MQGSLRCAFHFLRKQLHHYRRCWASWAETTEVRVDSEAAVMEVEETEAEEKEVEGWANVSGIGKIRRGCGSVVWGRCCGLEAGTSMS